MTVRKPHVDKPHGVISNEALEQLAQQAMAGLAFKDAIECYKNLLKRERRAEWLEGLASAYAGRALALAHKGMVVEALVLWRNRAEICGKSLYEGEYLAWLLATGDLAGVLRCYLECRAGRLPEVDLPGLETRLAPLLLNLNDAQLQILPVDDPLRSAHAAALAAIAAMGRGEVALADAALKQISLRSPYRDLRPLLRAWYILCEEPEEAARILARLPVPGVFPRLHAVLQAALLPSPDWLAALRALPEQERQCVFDLKGCPESWRAYLIGVVGVETKAVDDFNLLLRYRRALPDVMVKNLARRLLPHLPKKVSEYERSLGRLAPAQRVQVGALSAELARHDARLGWEELAQLLAASDFANDRLRLALVYRHQLEHMEIGKAGATTAAMSLKLLEKILRADPQDKAAYLQLLSLLRAGKDLKSARAWLERALEYFPEEADVLQEAVALALAGNSYKKAATYAQRLLARDPINPKVRGMLGQAGLAQARKQIKAGRADLARKELDVAEEWLNAVADRAAIGLMRLRLDADSDGKPLDAAGLQALLVLAGGGVVGRYHLLHEGVRLGINAQQMRWWPGIAAMAKPVGQIVAAEVRALFKVLKAGLPTDKAAISVLDAFEGEFIMAFDHHSRDEMAEISETLLSMKASRLLQIHLLAAQKRWRDDPLFHFLEVLSNYGNRPKWMPDLPLNQLHRAHDLAMEQGNRPLAERISRLLDKVYEEEPVFSPFNPQGGGIGSFAMIDMLVDYIGPARFIEGMRQHLGRDIVRVMERELGKNADQEEWVEAMSDMLVGMLENGAALPPFLLGLMPSSSHSKGGQSASTGSSPPIVKPVKPRDPKQGTIFDD